MSRQPQHDFYNLTPDAVLDALEAIGFEPEAALLGLNSYENRVYQYRDYANHRFVVKFYRPNRWTDEQILEEHEFCHELVENEIPVVAPIKIQGKSLFYHNSYRFSVFQSHGGRSPNLDDEDTRKWLGRYLGRIHCLGESKPYSHRPELNLDNFARQSLDYLLTHQFLPAHVEESYQTIAQHIIDACQEIFDRMSHIQILRLHGDCHPSNVMWTDDGPHFVDFDDSRMGPAVQDIWMLINDKEDRKPLDDILTGYEDFREFNDAELKLIEPLRAMRMIHYSAWLAKRWADPSFQMNFPWFDSNRYWEEQILYLREQFAEIQNQ
ncbi:MAG: serine/threonine protein kinase [Gammaproteobacteria bacterium]|nr:serine/threonine protein kinase [Gammaproteobacteria bacterium]